MLPLKYSKFFRSGFLAKKQHKGAQEESFTESSTSCRRNSVLSISSRRNSKRLSRPISLIIPSVSSSSESSSSHSTRDKRSSCNSFSSWLFDRKSTTSEDYLSFSNSPPPNGRELSDVPEVDVWITAGGPYTPKDIEQKYNHPYIQSKDTESNSPTITRSIEHDFFSQTIDPFAPSPDTKSTFIDLPKIRPPTPTTAEQESFLSLSASSQERSSIMNLYLPIPHKDRPTSIQTMPLPARSRPTSFHRKSKSDKSRWSIATSTDLPTDATPSALQNGTDTDITWPDPTHLTDWLDLLEDD